MKGFDRLGPVVQGAQQERPQPSSSKPLTMTEQMERLEGKVTHQGEQIQQLSDYQYACNNTIGEIMRMLAVGMAVDMSQFPTMPIYLGCPLAEDHGPSQEGDLGGDGEEVAEEEEL